MESEGIDLDEKRELAPVEAPSQKTEAPSTEKAVEEAVEAIAAATKMNETRLEFDAEKVSSVPENAEKVEALAERVLPDPGPVSPMEALAKEEAATANARRKASAPNPVVVSLNAALEKETVTARKLDEKSAEADRLIGKIDKLLDLTAELSRLPDEDKVTFSEKTQSLLEELKQQGIDLWKGAAFKDVPKEKMHELKSLISSQTDKLRTQQQMVLTKMQSYTHDLMAILESAKGIVRDDGRLKATLTRNQRVGA